MSPAASALAGRLSTARKVLGVSGPQAASNEAGLLDVLRQTIEALGPDVDPDSAWLLVVALTGAMPDQTLVRSVTRALMMKGAEEAAVWLLRATAATAMDHGHALVSLEVISDRPLVDVNHTAKSTFLTGIQRVVRGVAAEWHAKHEIELIAWSSRGNGYRPLTIAERTCLLEADVDAFDPDAEQAASVAAGVDVEPAVLVIPWGVPVVLIEVPPVGISDQLTAVAALTNSSVRLVGHDCIPISSAETVDLSEGEKFGHYLELVKRADRIAAVSGTAAAEFEGFTSALSAQGLGGPRVSACPLPYTTPVRGQSAPVDPAQETQGPLVACIGTIGRRKNQTALVEAAELLWRDGVTFRLRLLGHVAAERTPLTGLVPELQRLGRSLVVEAGVSDARIAETLAEARCMVFPTLHEGFGLPVTEALSQGVPVITSDFGSTRELAAGHGGLLVDPEDPVELATVLRQLLTDDELHARLVVEARARTRRTWVEYAGDLWQELLA